MFKKYFEDTKAVLFDLDGTIIDSLPIWNEAYDETARKLSIPGVHFRTLHLGISLDDIIKSSFSNARSKPEFSKEDVRTKVIDNYIKKFDAATEWLTVRDGFWELVQELKDKGIKTGIVSNAHREIVEHVTQRLDLTQEFFDIIISGDEVKKRKPNPAIYNKAVKQLGIHGHQTLVFEDSLIGAQSATRAKLRTIVVWSGVVDKRLYPVSIKDFIPDFEGFAGNLDTDLFEHIEQHKEWLQSDNNAL